MQQMRDREFVGFDTLTLSVLSKDTATLSGDIGCLGKIVVRVDKTFALDSRGRGEPLIHTVAYSYNAYVQGHDNILRYDNAHKHAGHLDAHHKHTYNWQTAMEDVNSPEWIGASRWPTLGQVLLELETWYHENAAQLPSQDFPNQEDLRG